MVAIICVKPDSPFARVTLTNFVSGRIINAHIERIVSMVPATKIANCTDQIIAMDALAKMATNRANEEI